MHDDATLRWHRSEDTAADAAGYQSQHAESQNAESQNADDPLLALALANHRANFALWHEEDKAREPGASDARIAQVKHAIDALNQRRNDLMETLDRSLLHAAGPQNETAPLHSETPGMIVDRLSILALKIYHTAEETHRSNASEAHHARNRERLALLEEQRSDLALCLDALWQQVLGGHRRFKLYRQMKMYNDPELNPLVYSHKAEPGAS